MYAIQLIGGGYLVYVEGMIITGTPTLAEATLWDSRSAALAVASFYNGKLVYVM